MKIFASLSKQWLLNCETFPLNVKSYNHKRKLLFNIIRKLQKPNWIG